MRGSHPEPFLEVALAVEAAPEAQQVFALRHPEMADLRRLANHRLELGVPLESIVEFVDDLVDVRLYYVGLQFFRERMLIRPREPDQAQVLFDPGVIETEATA